MKLSRLMEGISVSDNSTDNSTAEPFLSAPGSRSGDPEISSVHYHTQTVRRGGLFVAVPGLKVDGHDYIDEALQRGASAIITQKSIQKSIPVFKVENTRKALAQISSRFYGNPSQKLCLIGITGTNGKTTTALLIESILTVAGCSTGVIGTIDYRYSGNRFDNPVTTPESLDLQRILSEMLQQGIAYVVLEVSSHAVDLYRIHDCQFDIGVFTNLTQDHLDYHGDMQHYWACKKKFFVEHLSNGPKKEKATAIVCADNPEGAELSKELSITTLTVGFSEDFMINPREINADLSGISGSISFPGGSFKFKSPLVGMHNLENILCAVGVGLALKISPKMIRAGIESLNCVPGRLERITNDTGRFVFVDYAHTPDALKSVLTSLRLISENRIICVFGCGGDRDRGKRPQMGEIAGRLCDLAIITSDNPRTEAPMRIIEQIVSGIKLTSSAAFNKEELENGFNKKGFVIEPDRRKAIELAVAASLPGDIVLIAGKGHETYQLIGDQKLSFDDRTEASKVLAVHNETELKTADTKRGCA